MAQRLVISGYGWLAGYLGDSLKQHMHVIGTSRNDDKLSVLSNKGIKGVKFALGDKTQTLTAHLNGATFIINIPPGRRNIDLAAFTENMCSLIDDAIAANVSHIIFISTTSVYGDSTDDTLTEEATLHPETESAKAHIAIEQHLAKRMTAKKNAGNNARYTCVRLAGLVGPDRHPAKSLSGRTVAKGNKRVNLVYVTDVVSALTKIIMTPPNETLFHLCASEHPKRGEYYVKAACSLDIPPPVFSDTEAKPCGKVVDASQSWSRLGISPEYDNPQDMY